jgi:IMP dehydrogenase/GMP reductase
MTYGTNYSNVLPRGSIKQNFQEIYNVPIVSAAMDTVTEDICSAMAQKVGIGVLHKI